MTDRERLGQLVRDTWVDWARQQPNPKPSWLTGWDDLDPGQREVDMRIGEAVAAAERERIRQLATTEAARIRAASLTADDMTLVDEDQALALEAFADLLAEGTTP